YVFGFGFFLAGMYWIAAALFVDISSFWWALPFAVLGLPALFALWPAAALLVTALGSGRLRLSPDARLCLFAVAWSATEWGRDLSDRARRGTPQRDRRGGAKGRLCCRRRAARQPAARPGDRGVEQHRGGRP